jgi:hypothetical protein
MKRLILAALALTSVSCFAFNIGGYRLGMPHVEAAQKHGLTRCTVAQNKAICTPIALQKVGSSDATSLVHFEDKRIIEISTFFLLDRSQKSDYWQGDLSEYQKMLGIEDCATIGRVRHYGPERRIPDRHWIKKCSKGADLYREIELVAHKTGGGTVSITVKRDRNAVRRLKEEIADEKARYQRKEDAMKFQRGG